MGIFLAIHGSRPLHLIARPDDTDLSQSNMIGCQLHGTDANIANSLVTPREARATRSVKLECANVAESPGHVSERLQRVLQLHCDSMPK